LPSDWPGVKHYKHVEDLLLQETALDVVIVATPNGLHENQAIQCLRKNLHVIVEKPIAITKAGAWRVLQTAQAQNRYVFCVMQNRYTPVMQWLKKARIDGCLGDPFMIQINCFWNRDDRYYTPESWRGKKNMDGGPLFTQFSHFVDALYWLFGDVKTIISATFQNVAHQHSTAYEDTGVMVLEMENAAITTIHYTTATPHRNAESSLTILTKDAAIKIGGQYMEAVQYCIAPADFPPPPEPTAPHDYRLELLQNAVDTIRQVAISPTNAADAVKVVEMIENIYQWPAHNQ